jgi:hypothetical protein
MDIPTSCTVVGISLQLASQQRDLRSGGPAPPRAAAIPQLKATLEQQKIQLLRTMTFLELSSRRVKLSPPLFIHLSDPKTVTLLHALLTYRLATALPSDWSGHSSTQATQVEDLP